jgi:hypothetical protein
VNKGGLTPFVPALAIIEGDFFSENERKACLDAIRKKLGVSA